MNKVKTIKLELTKKDNKILLQLVDWYIQDRMDNLGEINDLRDKLENILIEFTESKLAENQELKFQDHVEGQD